MSDKRARTGGRPATTRADSAADTPEDAREATAPVDPTVTLNRRGARRARGAHPWIYRSDVASASAEGGATVRVLGPRARDLGWAFYSDRSQISIRFVDHLGAAPDRVFWRERLAAAIAWRERLGLGTVCRLVHAEADRIPSLVCDRYGDYLVLQTLSQGADRLAALWVELLVELLEPKGIVFRNDPRVRELEGLPQRIEVAHGEVPPLVDIEIDEVSYGVDLMAGQKTGLFLDQRENRLAARRYAHGRLLDVFAYHGAFALTLAPACESVEAVEISPEAGEALAENATRNGVDVRIHTENAFDFLRSCDAGDARYDTVVLDPPAFAKNKRSLEGALAGYKEINLRAMKLLPPGGILVTCSCSHHVDDAAFERMLADAASDVNAVMTVVERRGQSRDHPVRLGMPESSYLKCFVLRRLG